MRNPCEGFRKSSATTKAIAQQGHVIEQVVYRKPPNSATVPLWRYGAMAIVLCAASNTSFIRVRRR
ncbi:MAG: hypothetical protein GY820_18315 [Gammaproteobacteria bacterium]|nr:hypothetical protein [Gammaproteobacteria bacterium]